MPSTPDTVEVTIDSLAFGGDGVARIEGKACFIPFTMPGERCRIRIVKEKKSFCRAELLEVLHASGDRTDPVCPVFGKCGGCQYQHLTYEAECRYKEQQVRESFRRLVERGRQALSTVEWLEMDVDQALHRLPLKNLDASATILVDPPREGLSPPVKEWLRSANAAGFVYLSCNPATQARDLKELSGAWQVDSIQPIDLFPRTAHIESLVVCRRGGEALMERDHLEDSRFIGVGR